MFSRYIRDSHPATIPLAPNASNIWKKMWLIRDEVEQHLRWIINKGKVDVFLDKWLDTEVQMMTDRA